MEFYYLHERRWMNKIKLFIGRDQRVTILCNHGISLTNLRRPAGALGKWDLQDLLCCPPNPARSSPSSPSLLPGMHGAVWCVCDAPTLGSQTLLGSVATNDRILQYSQAVVSVYLFLLCKQPITLGYCSLALKGIWSFKTTCCYKIFLLKKKKTLLKY